MGDCHGTGACANDAGFIHLSSYGAVLVSTGVVRLDKRAAAPDRDKTGIF